MKQTKQVNIKMQKKHKMKKPMKYLCVLLIVSGLALAGADTQPWTPWVNFAGLAIFLVFFRLARRLA
jgi:hypothetical protein